MAKQCLHLRLRHRGDLAARDSRNSCGHDFDFHIQSWLAVAQSWHHGVFYPHWIDGANYGAGEPRFVFYPPLSWMLGALLGTIFGWHAAPAVFTFIVLTASGHSMSKLAREWLPKNAATIAACAYILNPYTLFVAYERTAYSEFAAGIWLPLIAFYVLRDSTRVRHPERGSPRRPMSKDLRFASAARDAGTPGTDSGTWVPLKKSTLPLALSVAAIWLTNAPAAVMACYALGAIALWQSIARRQWRPILNSAISLILGLGLASFYLVPAAYERHWVDIARAIGTGMRIEDSFLFGHTGESFHDQVLRTASWIFVSMSVTIFASLLTAWWRKSTSSLLLPLFVTANVLLALQLPWSGPLWHLAPELSFLQFPWRWTLVLSIPFALAIGAATSTRSKQQAFRLLLPAVLVAAIAASSLAALKFWQPCDDEDAVSAQIAIFQSHNGFEGTDEYTPIGADNSLVQQSLPEIRVFTTADAETAANPATEDQANPTYSPDPQAQIAARIKVAQWFSERKDITVTTRTSGFAILRLMDYPAWKVRINGSPVVDRPHRDDGLMTIPVAVGNNHAEVFYNATMDVWLGRAISVSSLIIVLALGIAQKRRVLI